MDSFGLSLRNPWIVYFLIPIFTFASGSLTLFIITSLILGSSAFMFLSHSKHSLQVLDQEDEFELMNSDQDDSNPTSNAASKGFLNLGSPDSCSESGIIGQFSCTSEVDSDFDGWQYSGEPCRITECLDGSISEEESLIEIELPGGHYVGYNNNNGEGEPKFCRRQKSSDSVLWWPEMSEEENMIEIDIFMGSIKCSGFEIKA